MSSLLDSPGQSFKMISPILPCRNNRPTIENSSVKAGLWVESHTQLKIKASLALPFGWTKPSNMSSHHRNIKKDIKKSSIEKNNFDRIIICICDIVMEDKSIPFLKSLENYVQQHNMTILKLDATCQQDISLYEKYSFAPNEWNNQHHNEDIISGFNIFDGQYCIVGLEAVHGLSMKKLDNEFISR